MPRKKKEEVEKIIIGRVKFAEKKETEPSVASNESETKPEVDLIEKAKSGAVLTSEEIEALSKIIKEPIEVNIAYDPANTGKFKIKVEPYKEEKKSETLETIKETSPKIVEEIPKKA